VTVLFGCRVIMALAVKIARWASGEHEWTAHHWGVYTRVRRSGRLFAKGVNPLNK
jgi:hypothetical protein